MSKVATTIRIEAELRASLNKICVRTGDQTYHIEQALRAYGPIKKLTAKQSKSKALVVDEHAIPAGINIKAWDEWLRSPSSKVSKASANKQFALLVQYSEADQQFIIDASINSGWQGLFPLKGQQKAVESFVDKNTNAAWRDDLLSDEG